MKLADIKLLTEQADPTEVQHWMTKYQVKHYELHDDGTVSISSQSLVMTIGKPESPIPFKAIRRLSGSIKINCYNNASSRLDKFIQRADQGTITVDLSEPGPLLSLARIKGSSRVHAALWGKKKNGAYGQLLDLGNELTQDLNDIRYGAVDILEIQQKWMDAGLGVYAKL